uniref:Uncharacterized protein n=1 Tax=Arundo donax TaxID=35708 RepID=A0A0A8ZZB9_ARUDO
MEFLYSKNAESWSNHKLYVSQLVLLFLYVSI